MSRKTSRRSKRVNLKQDRQARLFKTETPYRGYDAKGGGYANLPSIVEYRGTSRNICGLYPFNGSSSPLISPPLGVHATTLEPFGVDPFSLFDARAIANPSLFILGSPGIGKSTLIRRMVLSVMATGTNVLVLGDRKNEYTVLIELCGGEVIHLGPGRGTINILDPGEVIEAAARIADQAAQAADDGDYAQSAKLTEVYDALIADMHNRRLQMTVSLIETYRDGRVEGQEQSMVDMGLRWLHDHQEQVPILSDLLRVIRQGPEEVRAVSNDRGSDARYQDAIEGLEASLAGLCSGGGLGAMFNGESTAAVPRDRSVSFDLAGISVNERGKLGAAYLAAWSAGFGMVNVAHALADAGIEPRRRFLTVQDEFWQPLSTGPAAVERSREMSKLNREYGAGNIYAMHMLSDNNAIKWPEAREQAKAIPDHCGAIIYGGLPLTELKENHSDRLTDVEKDWIMAQNAPAPLTRDGTKQDMPGRGKFGLKLPQTPMIPFQVQVPPNEDEAGVHDTNKRIRKQEVMA